MMMNSIITSFGIGAQDSRTTFQGHTNLDIISFASHISRTRVFYIAHHQHRIWRKEKKLLWVLGYIPPQASHFLSTFTNISAT
jgi:hypothetical protein